jgi:hypothetical protein
MDSISVNRATTDHRSFAAETGYFDVITLSARTPPLRNSVTYAMTAGSANIPEPRLAWRLSHLHEAIQRTLVAE